MAQRYKGYDVFQGGSHRLSMLLRCRNTTNHLRKRRHLHNTVLRATIICRKCQKAPREPKKNEFRIAHARKRENRFCTVAPLTCNPFNPNWISRHLEGTASCTRKSRSRGGVPSKTFFCLGFALRWSWRRFTCICSLRFCP